jgi:N-acetylglutamate synthase and related acetyltransferases
MFAIRRYRAGDLESVMTLHRICLEQVGLRPGDGVWYDDDLPRIEQVYLADRGEFLMGESDERVVAMGGLRRVDDDVAEMTRMRVHPDCQGRGYGTRMLAALEARAVELGYGRVRGDTTLNQPAAIALYKGHGWYELDRKTVGALTVVYGEKVLRPVRVSD